MACRRAQGAGEHIALQHTPSTAQQLTSQRTCHSSPCPCLFYSAAARLLAASPAHPDPPHGDESGDAQVSCGWGEDGAQ